MTFGLVWLSFWLSILENIGVLLALVWKALISMVSLGVCYWCILNVVNMTVYALEVVLGGISHPFSIKKLPNTITCVFINHVI